jgi:hypothetical protein
MEAFMGGNGPISTSRAPKHHHQPATQNHSTADRDRRIGSRTEEREIDHLGDDEEPRDVRRIYSNLTGFGSSQAPAAAEHKSGLGPDDAQVFGLSRWAR